MKEFNAMAKQYDMVRIDGDRPIADVNADLQGRIDEYLRAV